MTDHLGSVRVVMDDSANIEETRGYYPFGLPMPGRYEKASPPTQEDFTGHVKDNSTGLHYAGARYYSAALGRWTTTDPILGEKGPKKLLKQDARLLSMTSYNYSFDNSATLTDPTGLAPNDIIFEGEDGNTVRIETARDEVTARIPLEVSLKKSRRIPLPNFKETGSNVAYGIQVAASKTAMMATGTSQEAFMQAMAFGSTPGASCFAGVETAAVTGTSTEYSVGGSASFVFAWSTDNTTLEPKEFAGGYGLIGGTAEADMGAADAGINVEGSASVGSNAAMVEVGATGSAGPNLSFPFAAGPSRKGSVGAGGSVFLGTLPIPLGGISPAPFF